MLPASNVHFAPTSLLAIEKVPLREELTRKLGEVQGNPGDVATPAAGG